MERIFLYGDIADNFEAVSVPFVEAAGGPKARIALLLMGGPGLGEVRFQILRSLEAPGSR